MAGGRRFTSSTEQEIEKLLEDEDSKNTKRSTKVAKELFHEYLKEKNIQEPDDKTELAHVLKTVFFVTVRLWLSSLKQCIIKQLLDSVFVISGIVKVLIIPDIAKTSSNSLMIQVRNRSS